MTTTMTSIRLDTQLADEAVKVLGVKSRTQAVHLALNEIVALQRFEVADDQERGQAGLRGPQ